LKGEIRRLARKEVRATVTPVRKLVAELRRRVAQQRRLIAELERRSRRGARSERAAEAPAAEESQIRFSPAWVTKHRKKLKMSRRVYAKLVGVSAQSIFGWESGRTRPRRRALESWRRIRGMGKRELTGLLAGSAKPGTKRRARRARRGRPARKR
jgi:DNA-binding transcriptional regulator YiaG